MLLFATDYLLSGRQDIVEFKTAPLLRDIDWRDILE